LSSSDLVVFHAVHSWLPQTETWLYNQIRFLPPEIENHVFCETTENLDQFSLPNIHSFQDAPFWQYAWDTALRIPRLRRGFGFLANELGRFRARILHSHFGYTGWQNLESARKTRVKHLVTFYGHDVSSLPGLGWHKRYLKMFGEIDRVLCEGTCMAKSVAALGCPERKIRVHHLGVDLAGIAFRPRTWNSGEPLRILIAASFNERKGIPYALEALGRVQKEVPLEITLIGDAGRHPSSQVEKEKILSTIEKLGLQPKIRMMGFQPYTVLLEEAYKHHIFLSPSVVAENGESEGGAPVSIIEMAASGMPIISTTHCDIPEVIHHGETGLLAEERDVAGLVQHLRRLIEHPDRWSTMLEAGRRHIEAEYDARKQGVRLAEIYQELL
jgi:colanic acid/amylovoran biosynthesis glycosyltransferase